MPADEGLVNGGDDKVPPLPIVDISDDRVLLPVRGGKAIELVQTSPIKPAWQRWNDYGIGYFLTASADPKRPGLLQAVQAFEQLVKLYPNDKAALKQALDARATNTMTPGSLVSAADSVVGFQARRHDTRHGPAAHGATALISAVPGEVMT